MGVGNGKVGGGPVGGAPNQLSLEAHEFVLQRTGTNFLCLEVHGGSKRQRHVVRAFSRLLVSIPSSMFAHVQTVQLGFAERCRTFAQSNASKIVVLG